MSGNSDFAIGTWLDWALLATEDVIGDILHCETMSVDSRSLKSPPNDHGAYVEMCMGQDPLYLGVLSSPAGCQDLARALLGLEIEDQDLDDDQVADAVGEIANMLAGAMTRKLVGKFPQIKLEVPSFVAGRGDRASRFESAFADTRFDHIQAKIVVLRHY